MADNLFYKPLVEEKLTRFESFIVSGTIAYFPAGNLTMDLRVIGHHPWVQSSYVSIQASAVDENGITIRSFRRFTLGSDGSVKGIPSRIFSTPVPAHVIARTHKIRVSISELRNPGSIRLLRRSTDIFEPKERKLDPVTALSVLGSLASIASLLGSTGQSVNLASLESQAKMRLAEEKNVAELSPEDAREVSEIAEVYWKLYSAKDKILDRIVRNCLAPLDTAVDDDGVEIDDLFNIREASRICVCKLLKLVELDHGGKLPSEEFKALAKRFNCGMLR